MDTCFPLQAVRRLPGLNKRKYSVILCYLCALITLVFNQDVLDTSCNNKFIKYHRIVSRVKNLSDCWVCTHSPVSAKAMPYFASPLTEQELLTSVCWDPPLISLPEEQKRTVIALPVTGWTKHPWWQVNLTSRINTFFELKDEGSGWHNKPLQMLEMGNIPIDKLQISFSMLDKVKIVQSRVVSGVNVVQRRPSVLLRELHNTSWQFAERFPDSDPTQCKDLQGYYKEGGEVRGPRQTTDSEQPVVQEHGDGEQPRCDLKSYYAVLTGDKATSWCLFPDTVLVSYIASALIHGAQLKLPEGVYVVCGSKAYRWIPLGAGGTCTLAKLEPATWVWTSDEFSDQHVPSHMLYKRAVPEHKVHFAHTHWAWKAGAVLGGPIGMMFKGVVSRKQSLINTVVLDYLTASQGGLCQIVGPSCCHYINPSGTLQITHDLEQARKVKELYRKAISDDETKWPEWLSYLNPVNWFKGLGGMISGVVSLFLQGVLFIVVLAIIIKIVVVIIKKILGTNCKCFSGKSAKKSPGVLKTETHLMTVLTTDKAPCTLCGKPTLQKFDNCMYCGYESVI
ncbi:uncharacterized protein [Eleutherodactylus coqui]|uniref:uncharacterized protein n=1 Tax=Eleutherodactylus coqui TaxID=57060 RepID=UPI0034623C94